MAAKKPGPKSTYKKATLDKICDRLSLGEPLAVICRDKGMPSRGTVYLWEKQHEGVPERIARAREEGEDYLAAECLEIADNASNDWMERNGDSPGYTLNGDHVQRSKLRIETRLKLLAKWNPRKYGDRQQIDHQSTDGSMTPKPTRIELVAPNDNGKG